MKKKLLSLLTILACMNLSAQNYDCMNFNKNKAIEIYKDSLFKKYSIIKNDFNFTTRMLNDMQFEVYRQHCIEAWGRSRYEDLKESHKNFNNYKLTNISLEEYKRNTMYYEVIKEVHKNIINYIKNN
ncbi:lysozyme inhibitor LprI family protein [Empedobacter sedimenti]|uniref:hypothetical protein n=1 Tax=Empedobacter sedimenti TaxID=3042610 RepID=UPI0024A67ABA|nr:hypothetical protein [Empedobacter sedimenti]